MKSLKAKFKKNEVSVRSESRVANDVVFSSSFFFFFLMVLFRNA